MMSQVAYGRGREGNTIRYEPSDKGCPLVIQGDEVVGGYEPEGGYLQTVLSTGGATLSVRSPKMADHMFHTLKRKEEMNSNEYDNPRGAVLGQTTTDKPKDTGSLSYCLSGSDSQAGRLAHLLNRLEQKVGPICDDRPQPCGTDVGKSDADNPGTSPLARQAWDHAHELWKLGNRLERIIEQISID